MMPFYELSFFFRSLFSLWALLLCCVCIVSIVLSISVKKYWCMFLVLLPFAPSYLLWQVGLNLYYFGYTDQAAPISIRLTGLSWLFWLFALILFTFVAALLLYLIIRFIRTTITPMAIKLCADRMPCGICYWRNNGHVIFSNQCMNQLCIELTGRPLMNGNRFCEMISDAFLPIGGQVWNFIFRDLEFEGAPLHEMVAWEVTEIHKKTNALQSRNEELARLKDELKAYSIQIDDIVYRQEILQAKVNIHDEMNRLMLSTIAADIECEEEINHIFTLWERSALLLCFEADEKNGENAAKLIVNLAHTLDVQLIWDLKLPVDLTPKQETLFFTAAQEAIANAVKHGDAKMIEISFMNNDSDICCIFENDGIIQTDAVNFTGGLLNLSILAGEQNAIVSAETGKSFRLILSFIK